ELPRHVHAPSPGGPEENGSCAFEARGFCVPHPNPERPPAVSGFSARVRPGEIVGIAGLQGSGATELFHGLFGAYGPVCSGSVWIGGRPFLPHSPARSVRSGLSYLTADRKGTGLVPSMSV